MANYNDQVLRLWDEWIAENKVDSGDPADFVEWARSSGRLALQPQDVNKLLRKQVTQGKRHSEPA
jgi:hypothetical protein